MSRVWKSEPDKDGTSIDRNLGLFRLILGGGRMMQANCPKDDNAFISSGSDQHPS